MGERVRPKKSTFSSDDDSFHETDGDELSESESIISEHESSAKKKNVAGSGLGKKKIKRTGGYVPPVEQFPGINGNLLSSAHDWTEFITEQNSNIKRNNRKYKTSFCNNYKNLAFAFSKIDCLILLTQ